MVPVLAANSRRHVPLIGAFKNKNKHFMTIIKNSIILVHLSKNHILLTLSLFYLKGLQLRSLAISQDQISIKGVWFRKTGLDND